ncbi:MAG: hypothetical protein IJR46_05135 [Neisseriaceae bacterium]|nr:hypothetical protein [Neisseriaceae bacterium]
MNKIELADVVYSTLKRRAIKLDKKIKKLQRLEKELKEIENLIISSKNYDEEMDFLPNFLK